MQCTLRRPSAATFRYLKYISIYMRHNISPISIIGRRKAPIRCHIRYASPFFVEMTNDRAKCGAGYGIHENFYRKSSCKKNIGKQFCIPDLFCESIYIYTLYRRLLYDRHKVLSRGHFVVILYCRPPASPQATLHRSCIVLLSSTMDFERI